MRDRVYYDILEKTQATLNIWFHRGLTLTGKILVINSLMGSQFVHKMSVPSNIPKNCINKFNEQVRFFLWKSNTFRIALDKLQLPKD